VLHNTVLLSYVLVLLSIEAQQASQYTGIEVYERANTLLLGLIARRGIVSVSGERE